MHTYVYICIYIYIYRLYIHTHIQIHINTIHTGVHSTVRYMRAVDGAWWTKELDISGQRFEHVPLEICDVDSLTSLKMHSQFFSDIPAEIGRLTALTHLNLQVCL